MVNYKRLFVARIYPKGDNDSSKKIKYRIPAQESLSFLLNSQYGCIYTLSSILVVLLNLVECS